MKFIDLLNDADDATNLSGEFRVFLATRTVDGEALPQGQAKLLTIKFIRIDQDLREVGLIAGGDVHEDESAFTTTVARNIWRENPEIAEFELMCLREHQQTEDGSEAEMVCTIAGTLTRKGEIWLLLDPASQWQPMGLEG